MIDRSTRAKSAIRRLVYLALFGALMITGCSTSDSFSFGVIADVQYADKDKVGTRDYRASKDKLTRAVERFDNESMAFVVQLGDLIDGGETAEQDLRDINNVFNKLKAPRHHVLGNHDFVNIDRQNTMSILSMNRPFYDFTHKNWRFVVLDTMDLAVAGWKPDSLNYRLGKRMLDELALSGAPNAFDWNGGIGPAQKQWLQYVLADAAENKQNVIIFAHHPLMPARDPHKLWNAEEITRIIEAAPAAVAWFNGHKHDMQYHYQNGKYFVTFDGMVEDTVDRGYAIVTVRKDRIDIYAAGRKTRLTLPLDTK